MVKENLGETVDKIISTIQYQNDGVKKIIEEFRETIESRKDEIQEIQETSGINKKFYKIQLEETVCSFLSELLTVACITYYHNNNKQQFLKGLQEFEEEMMIIINKLKKLGSENNE